MSHPTRFCLVATAAEIQRRWGCPVPLGKRAFLSLIKRAEDGARCSASVNNGRRISGILPTKGIYGACQRMVRQRS